MSFTDNTTGGRVVKEMSLPIKIVLNDTCEVGDLIGFDALTDNDWERADANAKVYANFIAAEPCRKDGDTITVYREAIVDGFTGAVDGDLLYLDDDPGDYVAAPVGAYQQCVGRFINTTEALITPGGLPMVAHSIQTDPTGLGCAALIRAELSDGTAGTGFAAARIEAKSISGSTVACMRGIYMIIQQDQAVTSNYDCVGIRIESVGTTDAGAYIEVAGGADAFLQVQGVTTNSIWASGDKTGVASGWAKVVFGAGTHTRYIQLYTGV